MWPPSYGCFSTGMCDDRVLANVNRLALAGSAIRLLMAMQRIGYSSK